MRRTWIAVLTVAALALAGTASALVGAAPDGNAHPYVGMAIWFPDGNPADGFELCSGSLLSPTVFVTAAHCFPTGAQVVVDTSEQALADLHASLANGTGGVVTDDPNYRSVGNGLKSDRSDVAVVRLAEAVASPRYAVLPPVGYGATLPNNQPIDNVGYGVQDAASQSGYGVRQFAQQRVVGNATSKDGFLKISSGTTCFGDSGGPNLQAGTDVVLAVNGYGASATCNATSYSQRLDTAEAHAFVASFLR